MGRMLIRPEVTMASKRSLSIFQHVEGYEGLPDLAAVKGFVLGAQATAAGYARNDGGTPFVCHIATDPQRDQLR